SSWQEFLEFPVGRARGQREHVVEIATK
ncbi:hypothetical protein AWZ03_015058, partial [Drosophila navojoa]